MATFDQTTWQEDNDQHEEQTKCQVPTFACEAGKEPKNGCFHEVRQPFKPPVQNVLVDFREDLFTVFDEACAKDWTKQGANTAKDRHCLLYTSDAADDMQCVDLGGRRIIKKASKFAMAVGR